MIKRLKKSLLITSFLLSFHFQAFAHDDLPNIGTSAVNTITLNQEIALGKYYSSKFKKDAPMINDALLNHYINHLGAKLASHAETHEFPFTFYLLKSKVINAFAYFGGNVVVHSGLFNITDDESELASVMAHEIGHISQRHIARQIEELQQKNPYYWSALLGSIAATILNPDVGAVALATTATVINDNIFSHSQKAEQEADRIGINILSRAGFDPNSAAHFMKKLNDDPRFSSAYDEMFRTHPVTNTRVSDLRNRAALLPKKSITSSIDYYLAKARLAVFYGSKLKKDRENEQNVFLNALNKLTHPDKKHILNYFNALMAYDNDEFNKAKRLIEPSLSSLPHQIWFLDLMTDIDLKNGDVKSAITRLTAALKKDATNRILKLNLANSYIYDKQYQKATQILHRYTFDNPDDINGWDLLIKAYNGLNQRSKSMTAKAEILALQGDHKEAIALLKNAKKSGGYSAILMARIDARIDELTKEQEMYKKMKTYD